MLKITTFVSFSFYRSIMSVNIITFAFSRCEFVGFDDDTILQTRDCRGLDKHVISL